MNLTIGSIQSYSFFDPVALYTGQYFCRDVNPSSVVSPTTSFTDVVFCESDTPSDLSAYFFSGSDT